MDIVLIVIAIPLIAYFLVKYLIIGRQDHKNKKRPDISEMPVQLVENDKFVLIKNCNKRTNIAIEEFCNMYNRKSYQVLPSLWVSDKLQVVVFPYDVKFEIFCLFVNYMVHELSDSEFDVLAWGTTKKEDKCMKDEAVNKKVMLFVPGWDTEQDNVYLTTEDGVGCKINFAYRECIKLYKPAMKYIDPNINLKNENFKEFKFQ